MTKISGLLSQKPDSPVPHVGDKRRYSVEERVGKSGKPWTKVKNEGEGYGQLYEVTSVEKTNFTSAKGNVSFNIDLELLSGDASASGAVGNQQTKSSESSAPPAQDTRQALPLGVAGKVGPTVRSTSTSDSVKTTLDTVGTELYAALGKADDMVNEFFSEAQRENWSAYEAARVVLSVAHGLNIEACRR